METPRVEFHERDRLLLQIWDAVQTDVPNWLPAIELTVEEISGILNEDRPESFLRALGWGSPIDFDRVISLLTSS